MVIQLLYESVINGVVPVARLCQVSTSSIPDWQGTTVPFKVVHFYIVKTLQFNIALFFFDYALDHGVVLNKGFW